MNWHNLSEKEFDTKIKSYVEGKKVPFTSEAWDKMNHKLDRAFPAANRTRNGSSWGLLSVILLLAGLFFWNVGHYSSYSRQPDKQQNLSFNKGNTNETPRSAGMNSENTKTSNQRPSGVEDLKTKDRSSNNKSPVSARQESGNSPGATDKSQPTDQRAAAEGLLSDNKEKQSKVEEHLKELNKNTGNGTEKAVNSASKLSGNLKQSTLADALKPITDKSAGTEEPGNVGDLVTGHVPTKSDAIEKNSEHQDHKRALTLSDRGGAVTHSGMRSGRLDQISTQGADIIWMKMGKMAPTAKMLPSEIQNPPVLPVTSSPWSFGLGYAPDLSLVGFSELTSPGTNVAFSVDYRLSDRWSIQTGATIARKKYIAKGEDYHPPAGFWAYGVYPDKTDATCNVIDIPLNVRYYFRENRFHRFYASTGFSTYLMLREDYDYSYEHNYPSLLQNWNVRNENKHLFGIYNLSIGYQRALSGNWSMEIEPFIKAPISGIGFGGVNLWSTGTMFSLRFRLP